MKDTDTEEELLEAKEILDATVKCIKLHQDKIETHL